MLFAGGLCLLHGVLAGPAAESGGAIAPFRPIPQAGSNAVTRVYYAGTRTPYSLGDHLETMRMQLLRVRTQVEMVPMARATGEGLGSSDYVVVFCPQPFPEIPGEFLHALSEGETPVLWIGYGMEGLREVESFAGVFEASAYSTGASDGVLHYWGRDWPVGLDPWIPVTILDGEAAEVLMTMNVPGSPGPSHPVVWRAGRVTFVATVPVSGTLSYLFSDLLLDFYGVEETALPHVFVRIEDYHFRRDHGHFRRMVDYLYGRRRPFLVAVIPADRDPETGEVRGMDSNPEFVSALRYAQGRGGRLILHGYVHAKGEEPGQGHEFWDAGNDRPLEGLTPGEARLRIESGVRKMWDQGLFPLAWETPHYAASRSIYAEIGRVFSTAVERVQLSDATHLETHESAGLTRDRHGRLIVPENLGYVLDEEEGALEGILSRAGILMDLRGSIGGCYIHPYQRLNKLSELIEELEEFQRPFLDLAELDHWVQLPDGLFLVGGAERLVTLEEQTVEWRAYDRSGRLIREERDPLPFSGVRTFRTRGVGEYELFRFRRDEP
jgi:hypothetical protein